MTAIRDTLPTDPDTVTKETVVDFIFDLFRLSGDKEYLGEAVRQGEHAIQSAILADQLGGRDSLTAAALLHDVGHYLHSYAKDCALTGVDSRHEVVGSDFLARFFPPEVSEPVRLHVDAKRYLCAEDPAYFAGLSAASVRSLQLQGGPFDDAGMAAFRTSPYYEDAVILRRCDDGAKTPDMPLPDVETFRPILERLVVSQDQ